LQHWFFFADQPDSPHIRAAHDLVFRVPFKIAL
jgi:hypothetical protein